MKRIIHLICNAHIDPIWLWEWEEGAAEAISTFRTAARLCEENDDFNFCHNEALLYEWVKEYEPELFERIQKLVKEGKWAIIGGYYLQPDCNIPSGEAMIRQIEAGNEFFKKYFDLTFKTACNFDSFGHSRGLVQIMKKMGYENYLICRPTIHNKISIPNEFSWVGYDGSKINTRRHYELYNSALGHALDKVKYNIESFKEDPLMILWGVGNHGGGPSEKDINDINSYKDKKDLTVEIIHSTPDKYFKDAKDHFNKNEVSVSLWPCNTGCYTSMSLIKQKYRLLERELFNAEKISTSAHLIANMDYPLDELKEAEKDMIFCQFHDILPGTIIKNAETAALRRLDHALEILSRVKTRAFFKLSNQIKYTANGNYPIFVWNPLPYKTKRTIEVEFQLKDQNWEDNFTFMHVYDRNGNLLKSQIEKEGSNLNLDWRKHVTFEAILEPMSVNAFECVPYKVNTLPVYKEESGIKIFKCGDLDITFDFDKGFITSIKKNKKEYINGDAFTLNVFTDTEDPWGMTQDERLCELIGRFNLADIKTGTKLTGTEKPIKSSRIIEDGDIRTTVECVYTYDMSDAIVKYTFNKFESVVDIEYKVLFNENSKCLKVEIPSNIKGKLIGQEMFGEEELSTSGNEVIFHDYVGLFNENDGMFVVNNGTYGGSFENDKLYISLLRTAAYTGHPINDRPVLKQDRHTDRIDIGYREFKFRFSIGKNDVAEKMAYENENKITSLSFFTYGGNSINGEPLIKVSNPYVEVVSLRMKDNKLCARFYNGTNQTQECTIDIKKLGITKKIKLDKYEFEEYKF